MEFDVVLLVEPIKIVNDIAIYEMIYVAMGKIKNNTFIDMHTGKPYNSVKDTYEVSTEISWALSLDHTKEISLEGVNKFYKSYFKDKVMFFDNGNFQVMTNDGFRQKMIRRAKGIVEEKTMKLPTLTKESDDLSFNELGIQECENILKQTIVSQDEALRKVLISIYKHDLFKDENLKPNILLAGESGTGKTLIAESIAKILKKPYASVDMSAFTSAGYVGKDVHRILVNLINAAEGDIKKAENGILVLDEIDKKSSKGDSRNDFQKSDVLKSLLKILDGGVVEVELSKDKFVNIDTSKIIIICCGAFSDMDVVNQKEKVIGFNSVSIEDDNNYNKEDFIKYGMTSEFMGRINNIIFTKKLSFNDLKKILINSKNSPLNAHLENLKKIGIDSVVTDDFYDYIIKKVSLTKTGARELKNVVNEAFDEIIYEVLCNHNAFESVECSNDVVKLIRKK